MMLIAHAYVLVYTISAITQTESMRVFSFQCEFNLHLSYFYEIEMSCRVFHPDKQLC